MLYWSICISWCNLINAIFDDIACCQACWSNMLAFSIIFLIFCGMIWVASYILQPVTMNNDGNFPPLQWNFVYCLTSIWYVCDLMKLRTAEFVLTNVSSTPREYGVLHYKWISCIIYIYQKGHLMTIKSIARSCLFYHYKFRRENFNVYTGNLCFNCVMKYTCLM